MSPADRREIVHEVERALARILNPLLERLAHMSQQLDALKAQLDRNTSVTSSAVAALTAIKGQLDDALAHMRDNDGDTSKLQDLSDTLGRNSDALAAAIANTSGQPSTPAPADSGSTPPSSTPTT
jgi:uncharacterized phage infection (PIP) family protein YhgE